MSEVFFSQLGTFVDTFLALQKGAHLTRVSSIFSQMLQLFSRHEIEEAVREHRADRHARGFTCWGQYSSIWILLPVCSAAHALEFLGWSVLQKCTDEGVNMT